ncbi:hypothetical protein TMatcc_003107 [Talaromyces marneffei ATCC 18224]
MCCVSHSFDQARHRTSGVVLHGRNRHCDGSHFDLENEMTACILNHDFARRLVEESVADGDGLVWSGGAEPPNTKIHFLFFRLLSLFWSLNDRPSQMANEMLARRGDSMYMTGQCSVTE